MRAQQLCKNRVPIATRCRDQTYQLTILVDAPPKRRCLDRRGRDIVGHVLVEIPDKRPSILRHLGVVGLAWPPMVHETGPTTAVRPLPGPPTENIPAHAAAPVGAEQVPDWATAGKSAAQSDHSLSGFDRWLSPCRHHATMISATNANSKHPPS